MAYHKLAGAFMRENLATLLDDYRRYDRQIAAVGPRLELVKLRATQDAQEGCRPGLPRRIALPLCSTVGRGPGWRFCRDGRRL